MSVDTVFLLANAKNIPDMVVPESVDCIFTSPPYFRLRDYGHVEQIGIEDNVNEYIQNLVGVFVELRGILKDTATVFVNIGDTYGGGGRGGNTGIPTGRSKDASKKISSVGPRKQVLGVPWRFALAMQDAGYILRQDLIWSKPNPMPESVTDRFTRSHEYIFFFTKSHKYFFNQSASKTKMAESSIKRLSQNITDQKGSGRVPGKTNGLMKAVGKTEANMRSVFSFATNKNSTAHMATFPKKMASTFIRIGCPQGGLVLDPFCGSGTTNLCSKELGMSSIGVDLNNEYLEIAKERCSQIMI